MNKSMQHLLVSMTDNEKFTFLLAIRSIHVYRNVYGDHIQ